MRCALIQWLSSDNSDAIIPPISCGSPSLPKAAILATILFTAGLSCTTPPLKSVCIAPGATELTEIFRGPRSCVRYHVNILIASLNTA